MTRRANWAGLLAAALLATCAPVALAQGEDAAGLIDETVNVIETSETQDTCREPDLFNPLSAFGNVHDYFVAPGGDFEGGRDGWTLDGGAAIVGGGGALARGVGKRLAPAAGLAGHEPGLLRRSALSDVPLLLCANRREGRLAQGRCDLSAAAQGRHCARRRRREVNPRWGLSKDFKLEPQRAGKKAGWRKVAIRFRADDREGDWRVDDILIDPRMRG